MTFRGDDRGQAIQVGAVLLFAALIIAFSTYQAFVVPSQNRAVEFDHNQRVQGDLHELRSVIDATASRESRRSVAIQLGTDFPSRSVFLNPPDPSGELRLNSYEDGVTIENAAAKDSNGYWSGGTRSYTTSLLTYAPIYSEYQRPPDTVYEHTLLYNHLPDDASNVTISQQRLIDGRTINLVALRGDFSTTRSGSYSLDLSTVSSTTTTLSVSDDGGPIQLTLPTREPGVWSRSNVIGTTFDTGEPNAKVITENENSVVIELEKLEDDTTYDLRMGAVAIGDAAADSASPAYIVQAGDAEPSRGETVVAQVRDEFNNPVADASVSIDGCGVTRTNSTDGDGTVSADCQNGDPVEFSIGTETYESITVGESRSPPQFDNVDLTRNEREVTNLFVPSTLSQYVLEYSVSTGSNTEIERVTVELLDPFGNIYTSTTQRPSNPNSYDGRWTTPWYRNDEELGGSPEDYSATITVLTKDGRTVSGAIDVGGSFDGGDGTSTTAEDSISYNGDGTADGPGNDNGVSFSVQNTGSSDVTVTDIAVDSNGAAGELLEKQSGSGRWNREAFVDTTTDGYLETGDGGNDDYELGSGQVPLNPLPVIAGGDSATFYLYQFTESGQGNSGGPVDMEDQQVSVTLYYGDGSEETISFTG